ncbi:MAG TPA: cytochrome c [Myxococcota bacterium]|nr:cytochrome c [Myxococcota bacterium]
MGAALACSERDEPAPARPAPPAETGATPPPPGGAPPTPGAPPAGAPTGASGGDDVARGRQVYLSVCTACHNADPNQDGSVGPANAGASRARLEAKILRGEYPPGYTPKRPSAVMPRFENLAGSIDDLAAFLADAKAHPPR